VESFINITFVFSAFVFLLCFLPVVSVCFFSGPSPARNVVVDPKHLSELHISWQPPIKPNGEVTHYVIWWKPQEFNAEQYRQRNYCDDSEYF